MNEGPNDQNYAYEDEQLPNNPPTRSKRWSVNLTGMGARIAATALAIGLGVVIISYALRSPSDDTAAVVESQPTATIDQSVPLATWTPGPTSTPPPVEEPTPEPVVVEEPTADPNPNPNPNPTGALAIGGQAAVTGTEGAGVNMREGTGLTFAIIEILAEETTIEVIGGPTEADGYSWWQVRLPDGREGWVVQDFMAPAN